MKKEQLLETIKGNLCISYKITLSLLLQAISNDQINILLIGDPGTGKTTILKNMNKIFDDSTYTDGRMYAKVQGIDRFATRQFIDKTKAICIDNIDCISMRDLSTFEMLMDQDTTILATASPKFGRFDPYDILAKQINLPVGILNRFELIFAVKDFPDKNRDQEIFDSIFEQKEFEFDDNVSGRIKEFKDFTPEFTNKAKKVLKQYYVTMRSADREEYGIQPIPINIAQAITLIKLAKAHAQLRQSNIVSPDDANTSIDILDYCLKQIGIDPETGQIDIDKISTSMTASFRKKIRTVKDIIQNLANQIGNTIPIEEIVDKAEDEDLSDSDVNKVIDKLKRSGDIFEPKEGFISEV